MSYTIFSISIVTNNTQHSNLQPLKDEGWTALCWVLHSTSKLLLSKFHSCYYYINIANRIRHAPLFEAATEGWTAKQNGTGENSTTSPDDIYALKNVPQEYKWYSSDYDATPTSSYFPLLIGLGILRSPCSSAHQVSGLVSGLPIIIRLRCWLW